MFELGGMRVASLNHVCMWTEHGWIRVTAEEAAKIHPGGTVAAHSGLFMCELCGQYVTLTNGEKRVRYFKHSKDEAEKNCPERTSRSSYVPEYNPREHQLPIRLVLSKNSFSLKLGLLYVPETILNNQSKKKVEIVSESGNRINYKYFERLNKDKITYLSIGNEPSSKYTIISSDELETFWPKTVKGIDDEGSVFEKKTGKILPGDADVRIGKEYLLLTNYGYFRDKSTEGLRITKICERRIGLKTWNVYEIEATKLSEHAAKFFLNFHYRLTDIPVKITPIWPLHTETPYVIKHSKNDMIMYVSGNRNVIPKTFPAGNIQTRDCPQTGQVIKIACTERQQLISVGNVNVIQYMYLWREPLISQTEEVTVDVKDLSDTDFTGGLQNTLPKRSLLRICAPFDGSIVIRDIEDFILKKIPLSAKKDTSVSDIKFGTKIQVLQGLDVIWQVTFTKRKKNDTDEDERLLAKLSAYGGEQIPVKHSLSGAVVKLQNYPKTKQWLIKTIKSGDISIKAMKYLSKYIAEFVDIKKEK